MLNKTCTDRSLSEALIFASANPQCDNRLFIEWQVQCMKIPSSEHGKDIRTCCVQKLFLTFWTIYVHNMFSPCSAKKRASDKDLSVHFLLASKLTIDLNMQNKNLIPKWAKMQHMLRRAVRGSHLIASGISDWATWSQLFRVVTNNTNYGKETPCKTWKSICLLFSSQSNLNLNSSLIVQDRVRTSKGQLISEANFKFSFEPKTELEYFCNSALAL